MKDNNLSADAPKADEKNGGMDSSSTDNDNGDAAARARAAELFGWDGDAGAEDPLSDPLLIQPPSVVREGDHVLLHFGDGKQIFAHCVSTWRGKSAPVKISKRTYPTANLIGMPYGTVLEVGSNRLTPLAEGEDTMPDPTRALTPGGSRGKSGTSSPVPPSTEGRTDDKKVESSGIETSIDNRDLHDNNDSQAITMEGIEEMRESGLHGSEIVAKMVESSSSFNAKTDFSKAKYIARKQMKYQPRCRMVRPTGSVICEAWYLKDPRRVMNLREDSLAQILSYSNVCAGCQVMVFETCMGIITGALAQRMGGYGKIISLYTAKQPPYSDMMEKFNLSFAENHSIKWIHSGEVLGNDAHIPVAPSPGVDDNAKGTVDYELRDRKKLIWPCPLQGHTRRYLETMSSDEEKAQFLAKRCARFSRKLTRSTVLENRAMAHDPSRLCNSLIIATKFDPLACLLKMLPHLAPSAPFVIFSDFIEPLVKCFHEVHGRRLAINLRLMDTWMREYQVLPGRTHPKMSMSQSGGFILTGVKLCPVHGKNELDDDLFKSLKEEDKLRRNHGRKKGKESKRKMKLAKEEASKKRMKQKSS